MHTVYHNYTRRIKKKRYSPKKGTHGGLMERSFSWYLRKWSLFNSLASSSAFSSLSGNFWIKITFYLYFISKLNLNLGEKRQIWVQLLLQREKLANVLLQTGYFCLRYCFAVVHKISKKNFWAWNWSIPRLLALPRQFQSKNVCPKLHLIHYIHKTVQV